MKIMAWNVNSKGYNIENYAGRGEDILASILEENPDIIMLTEFQPQSKGFGVTIEEGLKNNDYKTFIPPDARSGHTCSLLIATKNKNTQINQPQFRLGARCLGLEMKNTFEDKCLNILAIHVPPKKDKVGQRERKEPYIQNILEYAETYKDEYAIIGGDFNPYVNPMQEEGTDCFRELKRLGWETLFLDGKATWGNRKLDDIFVSSKLKELIGDEYRPQDPIEYKSSDHKALVVDLWKL